MNCTAGPHRLSEPFNIVQGFNLSRGRKRMNRVVLTVRAIAKLSFVHGWCDATGNQSQYNFLVLCQ